LALLSLWLGILFIVWQIRQFYLKDQANLLTLNKQLEALSIRQEERDRTHLDMRNSILQLLSQQQNEQHQQRIRFDEHQFKSLKMLQESLQSGMTEIRQQVTEALNIYAEILSKRIEKLTTDTDFRLKEISGQVEKRLTEGFEKTTATFADVLQRLALIDEAQKKITELSSNVVSLQEILADKRSRGAFGEVQLTGLIRNMLPESHFSFQHTLSNAKRADCILFLPEPTGNIVIDAKFPLENFRRITDISLNDLERKQAEKQFSNDINKHIHDIADKYIIPGETSDGAVMFIPSEAVFAEIHAHYPGLVELSQKMRVWMVSPTTMMAILTTARAVLKDAATRKQVHIIQEHLVRLGEDFSRFQERMDALQKHIRQAHDDVEQVHKSSRKITSHFAKIEKVELDEELAPLEILDEG
jgi:DNA recombination protein RmuC